jgi:hypothetical protein
MSAVDALRDRTFFYVPIYNGYIWKYFVALPDPGDHCAMRFQVVIQSRATKRPSEESQWRSLFVQTFCWKGIVCRKTVRSRTAPHL